MSIFKTRRGFLKAAGAGAAFGVVPNLVFAGGTVLQQIRGSRKVRVAFSNEQPNAYLSTDGKLTGFVVDVAREIFNEIGGVELVGRRIDWAGLIPALKARRVDMICTGMYVTPARCKEVLFSEPFYVAGSQLVVPKGNPKHIESYSTLIKNPDLKFAILAGAYEEKPLLKSGVKHSQYVPLPDSASLVSALQSGRVDAISVTQNAAVWIEEHYGRLFSVTKPLYKVGAFSIAGYMAFQFRYDERALRDAVDRRLKTFVGSSKYYSVLDKYRLAHDGLPAKTLKDLGCSTQV